MRREGSDLEDQSDDASSQLTDDGYKKIKAYHEMSQVHRLTRRIYFQCLFLLVVIGVLLLVFTVQSPFGKVAPVANNIMSYAGVGTFLVLSFFAMTCGSENAQTKLVLIVLISIFLGSASGFFLAMNVTTRMYSPKYDVTY